MYFSSRLFTRWRRQQSPISLESGVTRLPQPPVEASQMNDAIYVVFQRVHLFYLFFCQALTRRLWKPVKRSCSDQVHCFTRGRAALSFISRPLSLIRPQPVQPVTSKLPVATFMRPSFSSMLRRGGSSEWGRFAPSRREVLSVKNAMVSFGIQFVKSNQYSNKFFLFWFIFFGFWLFSLPPRVNPAQILPNCFSVFPHTWRIKESKRNRVWRANLPGTHSCVQYYILQSRGPTTKIFLPLPMQSKSFWLPPSGGAPANCMHLCILPGLGICARTLKDSWLGLYFWLSQLGDPSSQCRH